MNKDELELHAVRLAVSKANVTNSTAVSNEIKHGDICDHCNRAAEQCVICGKVRFHLDGIPCVGCMAKRRAEMHKAIFGDRARQVSPYSEEAQRIYKAIEAYYGPWQWAWNFKRLVPPRPTKEPSHSTMFPGYFGR